MTSVARRRIRSGVLAAVRIALGLVFLYAGAAKALSTEDFAAQVAAFRIMPAQGAHYVAQGLPFFEAIAGFWLVLGWRPRVPALAVLLMSGAFAAIVAVAMARGIHTACGCFGPRGSVAGGLMFTLVTDLFLLGGAWTVYRDASHSATDEAPRPGEAGG